MPLTTYHVKETVNQLQMRSAAISNGLAAGTQAIVGATYHLSDGHVELRSHLGNIGEA
ncbi:hypothetical protein [Streptomyces lonegramiae]|uniref:Uncharacterized protein n=1 Tax=Streptomyces lonegramiae TaxID=3075524 RepID=A0ABU2XYM0_9ACTN|nr:hypothetical protein [Streptomyces sp. DSM 41529]MDT0551019.1 hypothetical protein [Streptomyces sp. DSM 41529]